MIATIDLRTTFTYKHKAKYKMKNQHNKMTIQVKNQRFLMYMYVRNNK